MTSTHIALVEEERHKAATMARVREVFEENRGQIVILFTNNATENDIIIARDFRRYDLKGLDNHGRGALTANDAPEQASFEHYEGEIRKAMNEIGHSDESINLAIMMAEEIYKNGPALKAAEKADQMMLELANRVVRPHKIAAVANLNERSIALRELEGRTTVLFHNAAGSSFEASPDNLQPSLQPL